MTAYEDRVYYGTRIFIFDRDDDMNAAIRSAAVYESKDDAEHLPVFSIGPSDTLVDENGRRVTSVFLRGGRTFKRGEIVTMYEGKTVSNAALALIARSSHAMTLFGTNKVVLGLTSRSPNLEGAGIASLINDNTVDVRASVKASRVIGRPVIVDPVNPTCPTVEFVPFILRSEFIRMEAGMTPRNVRIGAVALIGLGEGSELFAKYGDMYWKKYLQNRLNQVSKAREILRQQFTALTRASNAIQCRTK